MQAYNAKITTTPFYTEYFYSDTPILRGYQDKSRKKHPVSKRPKFILNFSRSALSFRRAKKRLRFAIACNISPAHDLAFWTFTFAPEFDTIAKNETLARDYFRRFMARFKRSTGLELKYVAIAELQKKSGRNAWHFHVLFFNLSFFPHVRMSSLWRAGYVFVVSRQTEISSVQHLIHYMSKYLSKNSDVGRSKKMFWGTRNLEKAKVQYDKPFDFSNWHLYSSSEVVHDQKTTYLLKSYYSKHAITNKTSNAYSHRKIQLSL